MDHDVQRFTVTHLRRRPAPVETGGFVLGFDPDTTSPFINYATPLPGAAPTAADVAALVAAFRERDLTPRLEFTPDAAPEAAAALTAAGFTTEAEHTYLVCTPDTLAVPEAGPAVEAPTTDADYLSLDAALAEAFGGEFPQSDEGAARLRRTAETGGAVRLVRAADGTVAGGALCSAPAAGTAELAGVGTRPAHRGRGIAAAVTAELARTMLHERGTGSVWLEYGGQDSRRVYERVGFRPRGTRRYARLDV
ncbi:GNAT family N-acetyltransferase [Streptomyces sp. cg28]|uniref:GNAT family N-acetyltransferase n=1 Tax=Streptomyces sp. cg28 TaxID=3403457 RepID=UPI003B219050